MGHFGAYPIRLSWTFFVLPSLVLNYFGQGALILRHPEALTNPFFLLAPVWARLPLVILATVATVIASQAVISGAYSMTRQCMQLGFLPRMTVRHTSITEEGQIYVPQVNSALAVGVLILVFAFKSSDALAAAYGIAVTGTFICTCVLATVVFRRQFHWSRIAALGVFGGVLRDRQRILLGQRAEGAGGRLGATGLRAGADGADDVVEAWPRPAAGALEAGQPAAELRSWRACRSRAPCACRAWRCS